MTTTATTSTNTNTNNNHIEASEERLAELKAKLAIDQNQLDELQSMWEVAAIGTFAQSLEDKMNIEYDQYDLEIGFLVPSPNSILTRLVNVLVVQGRSRTFNDRVVGRIRRWHKGTRRTDGKQLSPDKAAAAMKIDARVYEHISDLISHLDEPANSPNLNFFGWPIKTRVWVIKTICDEKTAYASKHMSGRGAEPAILGPKRGTSSDGILCFTSFLPHVRAFDSEVCVAVSKNGLVDYLSANKKSGSLKLPADLKAVSDQDTLKVCCNVLFEYVESVEEARKQEAEAEKIRLQEEEEERQRLAEEEAELKRRMDAKAQVNRRSKRLKAKRIEKNEEDEDGSDDYEESETDAESTNDSDYMEPASGGSLGNRKRKGRLDSKRKISVTDIPKHPIHVHHRSGGLISNSGIVGPRPVPVTSYPDHQRFLRMRYPPPNAVNTRFQAPFFYNTQYRPIPPDYYRKSRLAIEEASHVFRTNIIVPSHAMPLAIEPTALKRCDNKQYLNEKLADSDDAELDRPTPRTTRIVRNGNFRVVYHSNCLNRPEAFPNTVASTQDSMPATFCEPAGEVSSAETDGLYSSSMHREFLKSQAAIRAANEEEKKNKTGKRGRRRKTEDSQIVSDKMLMDSVTRNISKMNSRKTTEDCASP